MNLRHRVLSVSQFSLSPSPAQWGTPLLMHDAEPDDDLHNPDGQLDAEMDKKVRWSNRGFVNVGFLGILGMGLVMLL